MERKSVSAVEGDADVGALRPLLRFPAGDLFDLRFLEMLEGAILFYDESAAVERFVLQV